jgi:hypothetical protein
MEAMRICAGFLFIHRLPCKLKYLSNLPFSAGSKPLSVRKPSTESLCVTKHFEILDKMQVWADC